MKRNKLYLKLVIVMLLPHISFANIELDHAKDLATEAMKIATAKGKCISVAVVNESAQLNYFIKSDCAQAGSIETSIQKAKSSALFRKPTSEFVKAIKDGKVGILSAHGVMAVEGGVPILINKKTVGAIGIGGATSVEDEEIASEALKIIKINLNKETK